MYNLTDSQEKEVKSFLEKLPDSMVKSHITKLFDEVFPTHRMTSEQLEKFLSFQNALPKEFQPYPQTFAQLLKNPHKDTENVLKDSTSHLKSEKVKGSKGGKQSEEILHTLGETDPKKAGTKADPDHELKEGNEPEKAPEMVGNKTKEQAAEEEQIIARNQDVEKSAKEKTKPDVVVVKETKHKK